MFNDETQEVATSTNGDEVEVETNEEVDTTDYKAEALKWKAIAERKAKKLEEKPEVKQTKVETNSLSEDDILTITQVQNKDLIEQARQIAKLQGITLTEAVNSPMFGYAKQAYEAQQREEKASMEASRGSGNRGQKKDFKTSGLTAAEHKELWKQRTGR